MLTKYGLHTLSHVAIKKKKGFRIKAMISFAARKRLISSVFCGLGSVDIVILLVRVRVCNISY